MLSKFIILAGLITAPICYAEETPPEPTSSEIVEDNTSSEIVDEETKEFTEQVYSWQKGVEMAILRLESETEYNLTYTKELTDISIYKGIYTKDGNKLTLYNEDEILCTVYLTENNNFYFEGEKEVHMKSEIAQDLYDALNCPLAITGLTLGMILTYATVFAIIWWKKSSFGKKNMKQCHKDNADMRKELTEKEKELEQKYAEYEKLLNDKINEFNNKIENTKGKVDVIIENSRNENILKLKGEGDNEQAKETTEHETKTEKI